MADTLREKIIQDIKTAIDGFTFTELAGASIYRGVIRFQEELEDLPIISIIPREEESNPTVYGQSVNLMEVLIATIVAVGDDNPSELGEKVHGELLQSVFSDGVPTNASEFVYIGGGIESYPDELGQPVLTVRVVTAVEYSTDAGDPYNLTT